MTVETQETRPGDEAGTPDRASRIRAWFGALLRSLGAILATLAVLTAAAFAGDIALHRVTHTSHSSTEYEQVFQVDVVLDGDGAVTVNGVAGRSQSATLTEAQTSAYFDHPQQTVTLVGGTLTITVQCPDPQCTADLALSIPSADPVEVSVGNDLMMDTSKISLNGLSGPVDLFAWPSSVSVAESTSTVVGVVAGPLDCAAPAVCEIEQPTTGVPVG